MNRSTFIDDVDFQNDDVATPYVRESGQTLKASIDFVRYLDGLQFSFVSLSLFLTISVSASLCLCLSVSVFARTDCKTRLLPKIFIFEY